MAFKSQPENFSLALLPHSVVLGLEYDLSGLLKTYFRLNSPKIQFQGLNLGHAVGDSDLVTAVKFFQFRNPRVTNLCGSEDKTISPHLGFGAVFQLV